MKPESDEINWQHVHRTHEGNPVMLEDPREQFLQEQLKCVNQRIANLQFTTIDPGVRINLSIKYHRELNQIQNELAQCKN